MFLVSKYPYLDIYHDHVDLSPGNQNLRPIASVLRKGVFKSGCYFKSFDCLMDGTCF